MAAQILCEDFAPRDEAARVCGERGANRAAEKVAGGRRRRGISVKILLPGTKLQGFAGSGEQIAPLKKSPEAGGGAEFIITNSVCADTSSGSALNVTVYTANFYFFI